MKTSAEKSSHTTPAAEQHKSAQPFFAKAGGGDFFAPVSQDSIPSIQTKLTVNKPGDKFEQEADKMADKVMRMPSPASPEKDEKIQRQTDDKLQKATVPEEKVQKATMPEEKVQKATLPEEKVQKATVPEEKVQKATLPEEKVQKATVPEEKVQKATLPEQKVQKATLPDEKIQKQAKEDEKLQRNGGESTTAMAADTQSSIKNKTNGGQPLSSEVRSYMEPRFGTDFNKVRVHNDQESAGLSNQLGAKAFTYQNHVFFSNNQYQPGTSDGNHLLAHELTHTVQQGHSEEKPVHRSSVPGIQRLPAPAVGTKTALTSSQVVDISTNTFSPTAKIKEEIEAQGNKGLDVRVIVNGLTAEGRVKVRVDAKGNFSSVGKGSMAVQNEWMQQLGGMYINFSIKNSEISGGYASLKPGGGNTNDWLLSLKNNAALLGGIGLNINTLPTPVNKFENGKLSLGVTGLKVEVGGFVDAQFNLLLENAAKPKIDATADIDVKGIAKGQLKLDNTQDKLAGEVSLAIDFKSFSGAAKVKYNADGTVDVEGKGAYNANKLSGEVQFVATDLEAANKFAKDAIAAAGGKENVQNAAAPSPVPVPKAGNKKRALAATGQLGFNLTTWFAGTVNAVVDGKGNITVIGKIAPPAEIELFKQRDWDKELIKFEAKAYYGIPVVGNLNLFANISLHALAKLGPAKIYNIEILGTYSTDPEVQKSIQISGSINISAYAGLRLRAEGGAGIEILSHDLKFGVGLNADIGVKAYADARPTIGYRDPGVFYISGTLEMVAQPMLGLGGDFFIAIETPWWSPLSDDRWTWPLFSKEWPLTDPIGLSATVKDYVLGSGQAPEIEMKKPEFDPSKFMTSMVDKTLPEKSGGKGEGKGEFKEDGSVPKPDVTPKKPAPKKPDVKPGKKGTTPKGDKSKAPDPKAMKELDTGKIFKKATELLSALKGKEPYNRTDLDKELSKIKGQVSSLDLDVKQKGDKWVVTPKAGGKLAKKGVELAMKKDGAISDESKKGIAALNQVTEGYASKGATKEEMTTAVKSVRRKFKFKSIEVEQKDGFWYFDYEINPKGKKKGPRTANVAKDAAPVSVGDKVRRRDDTWSNGVVDSIKEIETGGQKQKRVFILLRKAKSSKEIKNGLGHKAGLVSVTVEQLIKDFASSPESLGMGGYAKGHSEGIPEHNEYEPKKRIETKVEGGTVYIKYETIGGAQFDALISADQLTHSISGTKLKLKENLKIEGRGITQDSPGFIARANLNRSHLIADQFLGSGYKSSANLVSASAEYNQVEMKRVEDDIVRLVVTNKAKEFDLAVKVKLGLLKKAVVIQQILGKVPAEVKDSVKASVEQFSNQHPTFKVVLEVKYMVSLINAETNQLISIPFGLGPDTYIKI